MDEYIIICKLNLEKIGKYKDIIVNEEVILTNERLNSHILVYHNEEYFQIKDFIKSIINEPDLVLEDNSHKNTLIYLKHIEEISKKARIVIKLATDIKDERYNKNSIITIMRQRDKSWEQTIKNKGKIIYEKLDKNE